MAVCESNKYGSNANLLAKAGGGLATIEYSGGWQPATGTPATTILAGNTTQYVALAYQTGSYGGFAARGDQGIDLISKSTGAWVQTSITATGKYLSLAENGTTANAFFALTVPEPSSIVLLGMGVMGLLAYAWRKRK